MNLDLSPISKFVENLAGDATAAEWIWQAGVLAAALALSWYVARLLARAVNASRRWKFGAGAFDPVAFPALAAAFLWIGRFALEHYDLSVVMLEIAQSLLVALAAIRFAEYVLGHILPPGEALRTVVRAIAWIAWIAVALHLTGLLPQVLDRLEDVSFKFGKSEVTMLDLLKGLAAMALTVTLALWISRITEGRVMSSESMEMTTRVVISKVVRIVTLFLAIFIALPLAGIDVTTLSIFSGALGVGLGFGLQKIASNYVSGFIVLLDRSLRIGDVVTVDGRRGEVKAIESRYTVIKGGDGVESIIPNEKMITESVNHHSYSDPKVSLVVSVWVAYESDVDLACSLLLEAAGRQGRVIADPAAAARVKQLGERGVELELTVWICDPAQGDGDLRSDVLKEVLRTFKARGVEIPYPRRDVRLIATDEIQEVHSLPRS
jgi:small-conductance mechanosensitive channel